MTSAAEPRARIREELGGLDPSLLNAQERAERELHQRAEARLALWRSTLRAALITIPLLIWLPFLGVCSLIYFGVRLGRRAFRILYEPQLRERFLQEEVRRQVSTRVSSERRNLEGAHHRSLEQLSASIAHEIRNPITAAKSLVQQMGEDPAGVDQVEYAKVAVAELERVERSISHLLRFAREDAAEFTPLVLEDVLESALETFRDRAQRSGIELVRRYDADGRLSGDAEQLRRVVIHLVTNAIDALEDALAAGRVAQPALHVSMGENRAGNEVWVRIADNAPGVAPDAARDDGSENPSQSASRSASAQASRASGRAPGWDRRAGESIFDPFSGAREEGVGLGFALCRKIVDAHHGSIEVESEAGQGSAFRLVFQRHASEVS